ncbi:hypothetical protein EVAR_88536_1 [Eumeta japonica]|uniref:Uncharacterized protein n=1 Tax=Eumeta variegata TaxID=151549 RepID=A0A4C1WKQ0_EUMVA|nr:hypothetical protein EVAR_88536_1 [Eumeta japonica]
MCDSLGNHLVIGCHWTPTRVGSVYATQRGSGPVEWGNMDYLDLTDWVIPKLNKSLEPLTVQEADWSVTDWPHFFPDEALGGGGGHALNIAISTPNRDKEKYMAVLLVIPSTSGTFLVLKDLISVSTRETGGRSSLGSREPLCRTSSSMRCMCKMSCGGKA